MIRHLNRTGRRAIQRSHAVVTLRRLKETDLSEDSDHCFDLQLDLSSYGFPANARVRVEAWRGNAFQRWKWGTVGRPVAPPESERVLRDVPHTCRFRVAVVKAGDSGLLLGLADKMVPRRPVESILPLVLKDLGSQIWRLEFGEGDDIAELQVNNRIAGMSDVVRNDSSFRALVMPQVLRSVLERGLLVRHENLEEAESPWRPWFDLATDLLPNDPAPVLGENAQDDEIERADRWIERVVDAFSEKRVKAVKLYGRRTR